MERPLRFPGFKLFDTINLEFTTNRVVRGLLSSIFQTIGGVYCFFVFDILLIAANVGLPDVFSNFVLVLTALTSCIERERAEEKKSAHPPEEDWNRFRTPKKSLK